MSENDQAPEWAPRPAPEPGAPPASRMFFGAPEPGGPPPPRPPAHGGGGDSSGAGRRGGSGSGSHAAPGGPVMWPRRPRRGVLIGPLAGAMALTVLAGAGVYFLVGGADCSGDDSIALQVAAAPEIAPAAVKAAGRFNDARHEIDGKCARAEVASTDPAAVATLLSGKGVSGVTRKPDVWIPDSSLWLAMAQGSSTSSATKLTRGGSMANSPIVAAMPRTLADRLGGQGALAQASWQGLLEAAAGASEEGEEGGEETTAAGGGPSIPAGLVRLKVPDPNRTATGMGSLMVASTLLTRTPEGSALFTGAARAMREGVVPTVKAEFASFRQDRQGPYPVALAPEQAVFDHNAREPAEPAVAVYPSEGTLALDFPVTVVDQSDAKVRASRLLERALTSGAARKDVRGLGFRAADGEAPTAFGPPTGLNPRAPRMLPAPPPASVQRTMQSWARLSLGIRMLSVVDISGSMDEDVAPGVTRLQSTVQTAQSGLSLLPDDSELGQWVFSTKLEGGQDWREQVNAGPLGERIGSATRRQLILSALSQTRTKKNGDTGLYDTIRAAFSFMKRTYKPEFGNSIVLWTDGKNDDPGGPSLKETVEALRAEYDPERPVQIIMIGYGDGVDVNELQQIAEVTRGGVYVARTPGEVRKFFVEAISRRVCSPGC